MPFFSRREPSPEPVYHPEPAAEPPSRKHSLFHRNRDRDVSPLSSQRAGSVASSSGGNPGAVNKRDSSGGLIVQAREHVMQAEAAEVEADRALGEARMRVRAAKDHVWRLEEEAKEEARRAKLKQEQAREVSKRGKGLGRHGL
ncbi:hypothetical protein M440DRAFT_1465339 [Trichoderma longibrachiatum ATCC 18648]|uniref:Uncharacterized protein n=1 Tax=Trichoderma longibrachiatum ATCC 18648 TaxID=983965 RepID=A0A2T4BTM8_TRILO|nr:hypothetical protein M440DRAFT_1465339 [Trichoderma longibrachiatum ATCC 18648]